MTAQLMIDETDVEIMNTLLCVNVGQQPCHFLSLLIERVYDARVNKDSTCYLLRHIDWCPTVKIAPDSLELRLVIMGASIGGGDQEFSYLLPGKAVKLKVLQAIVEVFADALEKYSRILEKTPKPSRL